MKFKKGDEVRCITKGATSGGYTYGRTYEVKGTYHCNEKGRILTVVDDFGSSANGWGEEHFELVGPTKTSALQTQIGGSHYTNMAIQPIEYILANTIPFPEGNVIKYVSRWRNKGGVKDLEKAVHHLKLLIEHENAIHVKAKEG
jgi:hypothetical protein